MLFLKCSQQNDWFSKFGRTTSYANKYNKHSCVYRSVFYIGGMCTWVITYACLPYYPSIPTVISYVYVILYVFRRKKLQIFGVSVCMMNGADLLFEVAGYVSVTSINRLSGRGCLSEPFIYWHLNLIPNLNPVIRCSAVCWI